MTEIKDKDLKIEVSPFGATIERLEFKGLLIGDKGMTVGRFANRISKACFSLNGTEYHLTINEYDNTLHGGTVGFSKRIWTEHYDNKKPNSVCYSLISEDEDQGFPGKMTVSVRYTLSDNKLIIEYWALCDRDTIINLTNHMFFNMNGITTQCCDNHQLWIDSGHILETDAELIPTGKIIDVSGTRFDFRIRQKYIAGYDHSFVLGNVGSNSVKASLIGESSGIQMDVYTDRSSLQLYDDGKQICLETQEYPDAINHENFPSVVLKKSEEFSSRTVYCFSKKE